MRYLSIFSILALVSLAGCSQPFGTPTPLEERESIVQPGYVSKHSEDRITLRFAPDQAGLQPWQKDYVKRFIDYYAGAKDGAFYIAELIPAEDEDLSRLPAYSPRNKALIDAVESIFKENYVAVRFKQEVDLAPAISHVEAKAWKAIIDTSATDPEAANEDYSRVAPQPENLEADKKIAVVFRRYDVRAANCPELGGYDWDHVNLLDSSRINIGCGVNGAIIAQVRDKAALIEGNKIDPDYRTGYAAKRLNEYNQGTWNPALGDSSAQ